jgi:hypothetical protein
MTTAKYRIGDNVRIKKGLGPEIEYGGVRAGDVAHIGGGVAEIKEIRQNDDYDYVDSYVAMAVSDCYTGNLDFVPSPTPWNPGDTFWLTDEMIEGPEHDPEKEEAERILGPWKD